MPAILMPLTSAAITKAVSAVTVGTCDRVELQDGATPGLRLRVGRRKATWSLRLLVPGSRAAFTLGEYPAVTLAEARIIARQKRSAIGELGSTVSGPDTLSGLLSVYEEAAGKRRRSWTRIKSIIIHILGPLMDVKLLRLEPSHVQTLLDRHPSAASAKYCVGVLRPILRWAYRRQLLPFDPARLYAPDVDNTPRNRRLSDEELAAVLTALGDSQYDTAIRLLLLTLCRRNEVTDARWDEIDLKKGLWTIPSRRMKEGLEHVIPLSRQVVKIFKSLPRTGERVFPTPFQNWNRYQKQLNEKSGTSGWHRHDLRRTSATNLGRLDVDPHIVEIALAHSVIISPIAGIYNHHRYIKQHAEALQKLADFYDTLT